MTDPIVEKVREDLLRRSELGIKKYGTTLERDDYALWQWLEHAYEETLDKANYLKAAIQQKKKEQSVKGISKDLFVFIVQELDAFHSTDTVWITPEYTNNLHSVISKLMQTLDPQKAEWIEWWCYENAFGNSGLSAKIGDKSITKFDDLVEALYQD